MERVPLERSFVLRARLRGGRGQLLRRPMAAVPAAILAGALGWAALPHLTAPDGAARDPLPAAQDVVALARLAVTLTYSERGFPSATRPESFDLWLLLRRGGSGVIGLVSSPTMGDASLSEVSWRGAGRGIELGPGALTVYRDGSLSWSAFSLALADSDADGVLESGTAELAGHWGIIRGDVADVGNFTGSARASADTSGATVAFGRVDSAGVTPSLAADGVPVLFSEPVPWSEAQRTRLLADGRVVDVEIRPGAVVLDFVTRARLVPRGALPAGAGLELDVGDLRDAAGNPARSDGRVLPVVADPGPLTRNPGFERGLEGWSAAGPVELVSDFEGEGPAEGARQAVLRSGGRLEGYLDVPADASRLTFRAVVYSEIGRFDPGRSVVVRLLAGGNAVHALDGAYIPDQGTPCACGDFGERLGPVPVTVDLAPMRGTRAILSAEVRSAGYIGMNEYALVLDDVRVE